jgi:hypothetical protein
VVSVDSYSPSDVLKDDVSKPFKVRAGG